MNLIDRTLMDNETTAVVDERKAALAALRKLMMDGPPRPSSLDEAALRARAQVRVGAVVTDYQSPLVDIDTREPDRERVRVGWRSGQQNLYSRLVEDPSVLDSISTFLARFKRA